MAVQLNLGTSAGRASGPLPAAVSNPRVRADHDGAYGATRPTCLTVAKNGDKLMGKIWKNILGKNPFFGFIQRVGTESSFRRL